MRALASLALVLAAIAPAAAAPRAAAAPAIEWRVYNPFRFFKHDRDFLTHRDAFNAVVAANGGQVPPDVVERMEGALNPASCDTLACRQGWAAKSLGADNSCYGPRADGAFGYGQTCLRDVRPGGSVREDYVSPAAHSIEARLSTPPQGECQWRFRPVGAAARAAETAPCSAPFVLEEVPAAGGTLEALDAQGHALASAPIRVQDWLVLGLGDSYASGEGNPDRPVVLSNDILSAFTLAQLGANTGLPARDTPDRLTFDPNTGDLSTFADREEYYAARARWTSPDCHRSQYSHQFRVALQLAIEHPHGAVTLLHFACSGADALKGVFQPMPARELNTSPDGNVPAQLDQALDLLCAGKRGANVKYRMQAPVAFGQPALRTVDAAIASCAKLKRPIDLALLSLGGNDVGFSGLVAYGISSSAADFAPIADLSQLTGGGAIRFAPQYGYLPMLAGRLRATASAMATLLRTPARSVVQTDYEDLVTDQNGATCQDTTGLDAMPNLQFDLARTKEVETFAVGDSKRGAPGLFDALRCSANSAQCGPGWDHPTGFRFVNTQAAFKNRGICAMKDGREAQEARLTRLDQNGSSFTPYPPGQIAPYASRQRLFVTINDAFMRSNTQVDWPGCLPPQFCPPIQDLVQIASSGLYGGAFHRNAEGHAVVADQVMNQQVRAMFAGR